MTTNMEDRIKEIKLAIYEAEAEGTITSDAREKLIDRLMVEATETYPDRQREQDSKHVSRVEKSKQSLSKHPDLQDGNIDATLASLKAMRDAGKFDDKTYSKVVSSVKKAYEIGKSVRK